MATDLYKYFRIEARELTDVLGQSVLALEKGAGNEVVAQLLRAAHTLKGAARVVKQIRIAEHAHAIEEVLAPLRDGKAAAGRAQIDTLLRLVDDISALVVALDAPVERPKTPTGAASEPGPPPRADTAELDALLDGVRETGVRLRASKSALESFAQIRRLAEMVAERVNVATDRDGSRAGSGAPPSTLRSLTSELLGLVESTERSLSSGMDQAESELAQVRDAAERLRLVPASTLFPALERTVRDVAQTLGKQASFVGRGGDVRLDAHVLAQLQSALVQMARNAVAHGVERPAERARSGKPETGIVELVIERRGNRVACACRDDGAGIDVAAVRVAAEKAGILPKAAASLESRELLSVLMKGGLTTSSAATETSGRGIGLDVVRETMTRLNGTATLRTERGQGTTLELSVPVSLTSLEVLLVEASGNTVAIPLEAVKRAVRFADGDVVRTPEGQSLVFDGIVVPFAPIARSSRARAKSRNGAISSAVLVRSKDRMAAVSVDRLVGTANVMVQPLPALAVAEATIGGVSFDAEGMPRLVLDPDGLVGAALAGHRGDEETALVRLDPILVIDDSLTTRVLEQSILESAGYEVELAVCAEEGLEKAARRRYCLFLVDVEMPGMDGFTFVETTRADPALRDTPAILVSSRNAPEDLERGRTVGAHAYVVKGEFDQAQLLATIRGLVAR